MKTFTLVTAALAAVCSTAMAAEEKRQQPSGVTLDASSVISVLQTAIPSSFISEVIASPSRASSDLSSMLTGGNPPGWYKSLPTPITSAFANPQFRSTFVGFTDLGVLTQTGSKMPVSSAAPTTPRVTGSMTATSAAAMYTGAAPAFDAKVGAAAGLAAGVVGMLAL